MAAGSAHAGARLVAVYRVRADAGTIAARAEAMAVEQSVEMPVSAIDDRRVLAEIVGQVEGIADLGNGLFEVRLALAATTTGYEPGQLMNMLFGNSSIHDDVVLHDVLLPPELVAAFAGPGRGLAGLRALAGGGRRALTCSALKPQGLPPAALADLARRLALGGLDFIKDDHGLADQAYSPFAERVAACAAAVRQANAESGRATRYVPSLSGNLDRLRAQVTLARAAGIEMVLIAPMIVGLPQLAALAREHRDIAFMAHPALAGAARIAPPLLLGKLFRLFGADATIFPNHGGRFGYSRETCLALAQAARAPWRDVRPAIPVPAGGMTPARVPEMLEFYGPDCMLLIGGGLLAARERVTEETAAFTRLVEQHAYR
ncbi:MAG: RuBisCO large subunit C-terminal-like domain-containing protein [Alphaproteobacteria bacterium]